MKIGGSSASICAGVIDRLTPATPTARAAGKRSCTNSAVGGEQSGHIIFPEKSLVGDGLMTTLYLLETLYENKKTLSEMTSGFARYPQILVNVKVREKLPFEEVPQIAEASNQLEKELGEKGRLLLRYSGTENLARVMIEGENQAQIEAQANSLAEIIRTSLG